MQFSFIPKILIGGRSYPSAEIQSVYSTAPTDWTGEGCNKRVLQKGQQSRYLNQDNIRYLFILYLEKSKVVAEKKTFMLDFDPWYRCSSFYLIKIDLYNSFRKTARINFYIAFWPVLWQYVRSTNIFFSMILANGYAIVYNKGRIIV